MPQERLTKCLEYGSPFAPHPLYPEAYETKIDVMVGLLARSSFYSPSQHKSVARVMIETV